MVFGLSGQVAVDSLKRRHELYEYDHTCELERAIVAMAVELWQCHCSGLRGEGPDDKQAEVALSAQLTLRRVVLLQAWLGAAFWAQQAYLLRQ